MANEPVPPAAPPTGPKIGKSHVGMIVGVAAVVGVLYMMGGGHSSSSSGSTGVAPAAATGTDAPAADASAASPAGG